MAKRPKTTPLAQKLGRDVFFGTSPDLPRIIEVDLDKLRPNPDQPRQGFNEESIRELADSIDQHGLIQPIAVAKDPDNTEGFIVVAGERRFRAFQQLNRETIPAIITTGSDIPGAQLIESKACRGCHMIGGQGGSVGPVLDTVFDRRDEKWIREQIKNPRSHNPRTVMPAIGLSDAEVSAVLEELRTLHPGSKTEEGSITGDE